MIELLFEIYSANVFLSAASTSAMSGISPITEWIALSKTVARLSVMITESAKRPYDIPVGEDKATDTRLGWPARDRFDVIIARTT
jgi:hypothetical protein